MIDYYNRLVTHIMLSKIAEQLASKQHAIQDFIRQQITLHQPPLYSSFDLRCNGFKAVAVDPNVFPAGFNNICSHGVQLAANLLLQIIFKRYGTTIKHIALYPEYHTKNLYYLENIYSLQKLLNSAGFPTIIASDNPRIKSWPARLKTAENNHITIHKLDRKNDRLYADQKKLDLLITNNDFSQPPKDIFDNLSTPVAPPVKMGWYNRSKFSHFVKQKKILTELAEIAAIDPWFLLAETRLEKAVDFKTQEGFDRVADAIDEILDKSSRKYRELDIDEPCRVFVKSDRGTYGMNVYSFESGEQFLNINRNRRDSFLRRKGGEKNTSVIIQEGIRTRDRVKGLVAEPVLYCLEHTPISGFLRTNKKQSDFENLNARGMGFSPENLCPMFIDRAEKNVGSNLQQHQIELYKLLSTCGAIACGMEISELTGETSESAG